MSTRVATLWILLGDVAFAQEPPPFEEISVVAVRDTSAVVRWDASDATTSRIEYGTDTSYGAMTAEAGPSYFHSHTLEGLSAGTVYHGRIRARGYDGMERVSADFTFTTLTPAALEAAVRAARADGGLPKTYYVKPDGNDGADGESIASAWGSLSHAANVADAGDTIHVLSGTWQNQRVVFARSGIATHPIRMLTFDGPVTLNGSGSGNAFDIPWKSYIDLGGQFAISNYWTGVGIAGSHDILIRGLSVTSVSGDGIGTGADSSHITIDGVTVRTAENHGILFFGYPYDSARNDHLTVVNSTIDDTHHNGIDVHTNAKRVLLANNTLTRCSNSAAIFSHNWNNSHLVVRNNTLNNNTWGVEFEGTDDSVIEGNTITNSTQGYGVVVFREGGVPPPSVTTRTFYPGCHRITVRNNSISASSLFDIYVYQQAADSNDGVSAIRLIGNSAQGRIEFEGSPISDVTIEDHVGPASLSFRNSIASSTIRYSDGRVFRENSSNVPAWHPEGSAMSLAGLTGSVTIAPYALTVRPAAGEASVTVNAFDTSLPAGQVLADFTVSTAPAGASRCTVGTLRGDAYYEVRRDGVTLVTAQGGASGTIGFASPSAASGRFTVREVAGAPVAITGVTVSDVTETSARVSCETSVEADTLLEFGTRSWTYTGAVAGGASTRTHGVELSGLSRGTVYFFAVRATNGAGNVTQSGEYSFSTLGVPDGGGDVPPPAAPAGGGGGGGRCGALGIEAAFFFLLFARKRRCAR